MWLWISTAVFSTLISHSGYHLPFLPSSEAHDYHHAMFNQCFGFTGVLDYLHGTDAKFRKSKAPYIIYVLPLYAYFSSYSLSGL